MKSKKNAKPTTAWTLFIAIVAGQGVLQPRGAASAAQVKKQKQVLAKHLQATFGIQDDPILWDERQRAYVTSFVARDERPLDERDPPRRR